MAKPQYPCFICGDECEDTEHHFTWEFDAPICVPCYRKLQTDPTFVDNPEGEIIRREFKITIERK